MEVHLTREQEAQLTQLAAEAGTDAEGLVKDAIVQMLELKVSRGTSALTLPTWQLGALGSLHRRDIYNDAD